ncbi:MAG: flagellar assembly protein FliW [Bacteroidota bacterium]|nr:flagellar assembly protein FliW [Bacteroidota bacterium]
MKINTFQFGEIEFDDEIIITFSEGIFGFEHLKKYLLVYPKDDLFHWLNSVEEPDIAFPLMGVRLVDETFPQDKNHEAFGIVTLNKDPLKVTVNLKAPIFIDQNAKTGYQKIIDIDKYPVNYNLFVE